jgi:hypothetical protein
MTKWPSRVSKYLIPHAVVHETELFFRSLPSSEAIAYWTGVFNGGEAEIRSYIFPQMLSGHYEETYGHVDLKTAFAVGRLVHQRREFLMIQLHTHPIEAFHSLTDDRYPISHRVGFISIVVPFYGQLPLNDQRKWEAFEYRGTGKWRHMPPKEVRKRFVIQRTRGVQNG